MSIMIKGMEMPKNCDDCFLNEWSICNERFYCPFDDCPLVEIPVPHGRLIDEEDVKNAIYKRLKILQTHEAFMRKHGDIDLLGVMPYITEIPTVIEAESEKNEPIGI